MGITHHVRIAPPVKNKSVTFIEISIAIIEIKDIPNAVFSDEEKLICFNKIIVSRMTDVINPLTIAKPITSKLDQECSIFWK